MKVVIVGCGVVGAAIAYELSQNSDLAITVLDRQAPAQGATGAALGVLMGAISQKTKGNTLQMRLMGIQKYNDWVPRLTAMTGRSISFNQQGILRLCFTGENLEFWATLADIRQQQGLSLEILTPKELSIAYPQLNLARVIGAVYSPSDRQVDPTVLTLALVEAAQQQGVQFKFDSPVTAIAASVQGDAEKNCNSVQTPQESLAIDWLIIAAGLGSVPLTEHLQRPVDIRPVLGQALQVRLPAEWGQTGLSPVITGEDTHLVPLDNGEYWIGATVEFPVDSNPATIPQPDATSLQQVMDRAIALCPALSKATILRQWSGLRARPEGRPAPIIERLPGYANVILATGHYRNGVLLAPATAEKVRELVGVHPGFAS